MTDSAADPACLASAHKPRSSGSLCAKQGPEPSRGHKGSAEAQHLSLSLSPLFPAMLAGCESTRLHGSAARATEHLGGSSGVGLHPQGQGVWGTHKGRAVGARLGAKCPMGTTGSRSHRQPSGPVLPGGRSRAHRKNPASLGLADSRMGFGRGTAHILMAGLHPLLGQKKGLHPLGNPTQPPAHRKVPFK